MSAQYGTVAAPDREMLRRRRIGDVRRYNQTLEELRRIWDSEPKRSSSVPEDKANFLQRLVFSWVYPLLVAVSKESYSLATIPTQPTRGETSWFLGRSLSVQLQAASFLHHSWDSMIGAPVRRCGDPNSLGTLRWVGQHARSPTRAKMMLAGVEWNVPPVRVQQSELCDGEALGERWFQQVEHPEGLHSTFDPVDTLECLPGFDVPPMPPPKPLSSVGAALRVHWRLIVIQSLPRLVADCCTLGTPLVIEVFIRYLLTPDSTWSFGLLIVGLFFGLNLVQSLMSGLYNQVSTVTGMAFRSSLASNVFAKVFTVSRSWLSHPDFASGRIVNMMNNDIETINRFWWVAVDTWSVPFQIIVAVGLLYRLVGWCSFLSVSVLFVTIPTDALILRAQNKYQAELSKVMDERIRNTVEMLSGIRVVKYMGWEARFLSAISDKRAKEIEWMRMVHRCRTASSFINFATPRLIVALTIIAYHLTGNELSPVVVFPAISILGILRVPFMNLPTLFTSLSQFHVAMERLSRFFALDNAVPTTIGAPTATTQGVEGFDGCEKKALAEGDSAKQGGSGGDGGSSTSLSSRAPIEFCRATVSVGVATKLPPLAVDETATSSASGRCWPSCLCCSSCAQPTEKPADQFRVEMKHLLVDVTLTIPAGQLTAVVGPTGSGKSTLLGAILQHVAVVKGELRTTRSVSYVPQQPWLMGGTLLDNIAFFDAPKDGDTARAEHLRECIRVCGLGPDLELMPAGLDTEVGERGTTLSGGQKMRVCLARAVYHDAEVFLLDDITAALDAHVSEFVLRECVCGKLAHKTRVLVTHQPSAIRCADQVILLAKGGSIAFRGSVPEYDAYLQRQQEALAATTAAAAAADTAAGSEETKGNAATASPPVSSTSSAAPPPAAPPPREYGVPQTITPSAAKRKADDKVERMRAKTAAFTSHRFDAESHASLAVPHITGDDSDEDSDLEIRTGAEGLEDDGAGTEMTQTNNNFSTNFYLSKAEEYSPTQQRLLQDSSKRRSAMMTLEEKSSGSVPWAAYRSHYDACGGMGVVALVLAVFTLTEAVNIAGSVWISEWTNDSVALTDRQYLYIYVALIGGGLVSAPLRFYVLLRALRQGSQGIHDRMLESVVKAPVSFFDTTPLGRVINRFTRDLGYFDIALQLNYLGLLQCVFFAIASTIVTIVSQPIIAAALVPCGIAYYLLLVFFNRANREVRRLVNLSSSPVTNVLNEILQGLATISAFHREPFLMRRALAALDTVFSAANLQNVCNRWLCVRVEFIGTFIVTCVALAGVVGKMLDLNQNSVSLLSLGLTLSTTITQMLNWIVRQVTAVEADMNCVERMLYYTENIEQEDIPELCERAATYREMVLQSESQLLTIKTVKREPACSIELRHVSVRYRLGLPLILQNVSCTIKAGEKIGVVGRTGSGKSTLLLALLRMMEIAEGGQILVQRRDTRHMPLRELRALFSFIPQDPVLFEGTLRTNLDPFFENSDRLIWKALELAGMRGRVEYDPLKLNLRVVFGGQNFSVGERQMLCLARALLKPASVILMDEATANVDASVDATIRRAIGGAFRNHTVITVAHRLHTIQSYDRVMVMDKGRVVEFASPQELLKIEGGLFRGMVAALGPDEVAKWEDDFTRQTSELSSGSGSVVFDDEN